MKKKKEFLGAWEEKGKRGRKKKKERIKLPTREQNQVASSWILQPFRDLHTIYHVQRIDRALGSVKLT